MTGYTPGAMCFTKENDQTLCCADGTSSSTYHRNQDCGLSSKLLQHRLRLKTNSVRETVHHVSFHKRCSIREIYTNKITSTTQKKPDDKTSSHHDGNHWIDNHSKKSQINGHHPSAYKTFCTEEKYRSSGFCYQSETSDQAQRHLSSSIHSGSYQPIFDYVDEIKTCYLRNKSNNHNIPVTERTGRRLEHARKPERGRHEPLGVYLDKHTGKSRIQTVWIDQDKKQPRKLDSKHTNSRSESCDNSSANQNSASTLWQSLKYLKYRPFDGTRPMMAPPGSPEFEEVKVQLMTDRACKKNGESEKKAHRQSSNGKNKCAKHFESAYRFYSNLRGKQWVILPPIKK